MEMMFEETRTVRKTIAALAINKSLQEVGWSAHEEVCAKLEKKYECNISDCFDHPQYLRKVLGEVFGDRSNEIIQSIHQNLGEEVNHISTECFLDSLSA